MNGTTDNSGEIKVIIRTLAFLAGVCVIAVAILAYFQKQIPPELNTLTGGLVGSLTAMLVKTAPTTSSPSIPEPVKPIKTEIVQSPDNPVPVQETKPEGQT